MRFVHKNLYYRDKAENPKEESKTMDENEIRLENEKWLAGQAIEKKKKGYKVNWQSGLIDATIQRDSIDISNIPSPTPLGSRADILIFDDFDTTEIQLEPEDVYTWTKFNYEKKINWRGTKAQVNRLKPFFTTDTLIRTGDFPSGYVEDNSSIIDEAATMTEPQERAMMTWVEQQGMAILNPGPAPNLTHRPELPQGLFLTCNHYEQMRLDGRIVNPFYLNPLRQYRHGELFKTVLFVNMLSHRDEALNNVELELNPARDYLPVNIWMERREYYLITINNRSYWIEKDDIIGLSTITQI